MIFIQFMVRDCCEMFYRRYRYALVVVLFILPLITSANVTRRRRRPNVELPAKQTEESSYPDQIAEPSQYEPNDFKSNPYTTYKEPSNTRQGKIVVNVPESSQSQYLDSLSDSKTAEEYVHNALKLQQSGIQATFPERNNQLKSSQLNIVEDSKLKFPEYEVYENKHRQPDNQYPHFNKNTATYSGYNSYDFNEQTSVAPTTQDLSTGYLNLNTDLSTKAAVGISDHRANTNLEQSTTSAYKVNVVKPLIKNTEGYGQQALQLNQPEHSLHKKVQYYVQTPPPLPKTTVKYGPKPLHEQITPKSYDYYEPEQEPASKSPMFYEFENQPIIKSHYRPQYYQHSISPNQYNTDDDMYAHDFPKQQILKQIEQSVNQYMRNLESAGKSTRGTQESRNVNKYREHPKVIEKPFSIYQPPSENVDSVQDIIENLNDNIQFIYKARTRPPAPKRIPLAFDHEGPLKNIQEHDTPHHLAGELPVKSTFYLPPFIKSNYREINRSPLADNRPRSSKLNPESQINVKDIPDGPSIPSAYQPALRKYPSESSWKPIYPGKIPSNNEEIYDSYSPKYNHNPEGYGYQHNYRPVSSEYKSNNSPKRHIKPNKRGKRIGAKGSVGSIIDLKADREAHTALRPPPL